jgi:hypothetical protein
MGGAPYDGAVPATGRTDLSMQALLAEYASLRDESMAAVGHRMAATNFTFAAVSVLVAGLLTGAAPAMVSAALLALVIPQLAKAGLLIWLGEYHRSQRAGRHVARLEQRINDLLGDDLLAWESGLVSASTHMAYPYVAVVVLLLGGGYVAEVLGVALAAEELLAGDWSPAAVIAACCGAAGAGVWLELRFLRFFRGHWRAATVGP